MKCVRLELNVDSRRLRIQLERSALLELSVLLGLTVRLKKNVRPESNAPLELTALQVRSA